MEIQVSDPVLPWIRIRAVISTHRCPSHLPSHCSPPPDDHSFRMLMHSPVSQVALDVGGEPLPALGRAPPAAPRLLKREQACSSREQLGSGQLVDHLRQLGWYNGQVRGGAGTRLV